MIRLTANGVSTGWLSDPPTEKELNRLTIDQLLILCRRRISRKYSFKQHLIDHLVKVYSNTKNEL